MSEHASDYERGRAAGLREALAFVAGYVDAMTSLDGALTSVHAGPLLAGLGAQVDEARDNNGSIRVDG